MPDVIKIDEKIYSGQYPADYVIPRQMIRSMRKKSFVFILSKLISILFFLAT